MTQEKQKKVPNFKKKKEEIVEHTQEQTHLQESTDDHVDHPATPKIQTLDDILPEIQVSPEVLRPSSPMLMPQQTKIIDTKELINDLMFNKYFIISEAEASHICHDMLNHGCKKLHDVNWFLAQSEREELTDYLAKKHNLS